MPIAYIVRPTPATSRASPIGTENKMRTQGATSRQVLVRPLVVATAAALALTACGGQEQGAPDDAATAAGKADSDAGQSGPSSLLPEDIRSKGAVVVAVNPESPPIKFLNEEQELDGLIIDLVDEASGRLGLTVDYQKTTFDGLIPGVMSNRYDMIASIGDYAERHEQLDLVDYMVKGVSIIVPAGNPHGVSSPEDLCGLSVTFVRGVYAGELAEQTSESCEESGEEAITLVPLENSAATELALQSGQVDAEWGDSPEAAYRSEVKPDLYEVAHFEEVGPYGIGFPKDATGLRDAYRETLLEMAADGSFEEIMSKWGLADAGWDEFPMNQGPAQS